ncbi:MAG: nucleoside triphosphate pyrophosphohydrolase [Saccharofermentanales bacterium]
MDGNNEQSDAAGMTFKKDTYAMEDLLEIMRFLRSENGCPWDRAQTHQSIKSNVVEEAFEVVDAIDSSEPDLISDELGDLLLQVVFHSQMADEAGDFDFSDVLRNICDKLITRHTHLFGEITDKADSAESVLALWDKNKLKEKKQTSHAHAMKEIPRGFPALMRAYKIQKKAARAGFDWKETGDVASKVEEEFAEVREAVAIRNSGGDTLRRKDQDELEGEIGDLFFALVNYARFLDIEPEIALDKANSKFIRRFEEVEKRTAGSGRGMEEMTLTELDAVWEDVKTDERKAKNEAR